MPRINIAIDGPAASGKGTVAKGVARELGFQYIDTGAMFRTLACLAKAKEVSWDDEKGLASLTTRMECTFHWNGSELVVFSNGEDVTTRIRTADIGVGASKVSRFGVVRQALLEQQRALAAHGGIVMDGRDVGTIVLPSAELKIFLVADLSVRAQRRYEELALKQEPHLTVSAIREQLAARDAQDSHREIAPLTQAADAVLIDSSNISAEQIIRKVVEMAKSRQNA